MSRRILFLLIIFFLPVLTSAQSGKKKKEAQRKEFALNNYYIAMNVNALLTGYTGLIEYKLDSIIARETVSQTKANQVFLKSALINTTSQTAFHSDPLAAAIDTWALCYQLSDYFSTGECQEIYGAACPEAKKVYDLFATNFENGLRDYFTEEDRQGLRKYAAKYPIMDKYLNRRSIIYEISAWVSEEELRLKSGLLNMNDLMRDLSNQLEYYSAILPKQTIWQLDQRMAGLGVPDSLGLLLADMRRMLAASSLFLENSDAFIRENRDTVLASIDYQRRVTLALMQRERIAVLEAMSAERQAVLEALHQEREAAQDFLGMQQEAFTRDVNNLSNEMISLSVASGKEMIDYIFIRMMMLTAGLAIVVILGVIVYKRL